MLLNFQNVEDINKIDLQYLDDRCAEIFEY